MQTFLPYPSFTQSAQCLDNKRLGKQRVEVLQICNALTNSRYGWQHHPIVKMWRGNLYALVEYGVCICNEWTKRGYKDTVKDKLMAFIPDNLLGYQLPEWLGNPEFHASHRSNLLRKNKKWYSQFGWKEPNNLPYVWIV